MNFLAELAKAQQLHEEGLLDGIKWVTWPHEAGNLSADLRQKLDIVGVEVITAYQAKAGKSLGAGLWQLNQLATALRDLDPDDFVLKSRPDVTLPLSRAKDFLKSAPHPYVGSWAKGHFGFDRKIAVNWFHPARFFTVCDLAYAGHVSDLRKICNVSAALDFGFLASRAFPHLGTLCLNFNFLRNPMWREWLATFYPGTNSPGKDATLIQRLSSKLAARMAFEWTDQFMEFMAGKRKDYDAFLFGFATYYAFAEEVLIFPKEGSDRVGLAERQYWADSWPIARYTGEWPFSGLGGTQTVHELMTAPTTDPFLLRLRKLDPRKQPNPFHDLEAARQAQAKASPEFVKQYFPVWVRLFIGSWRKKMLG